MQVINFYKKDILVEFKKGADTLETIIDWSGYEISRITSDGESWLELRIFGETTLYCDDAWKDADGEPASVTIL